MLRFNNHHQSALSKPVDFYRPLTVDVSVEYELPKEVAPPPGSAPLLIIHPSAYFRSKLGQSSTTSSSSHQRHQQSQNSRTQAQLSRGPTAASRLMPSSDINSTLYYLTKGNGLQNQDSILNGGSQSQNTTNSTATVTHLKNIRSYNGSVGTSSSRSRSTTIGHGHDSIASFRNCKYENCNECISGVDGSHGHNAPGAQVLNKRISNSNPSTITKKTQQQQLHLQQNSAALDRLSYFQSSNTSNNNNNKNSSNNNNNSPSNKGHGSNVFASSMNNMTNFIGNNNSISSSSVKNTTTTGVGFGNNGTSAAAGNNSAASHKRIRMMNQQQQQNLLQNYNPPSQPMEPLNLAITPSTSTSLLNPSYHSNQFSTFGITYGQSTGKMSTSSNSNSINTNGIAGAGLNYASTFPHIHQSSLIPSTMTTGLYTARFPKDQYPVPVDKGSGSDSGVCSENDSDVSPPMAHPFTGTGQPRRSLLATQELSSSGCYCCCCPTSETSSTANTTSSFHNNASTTTSSRPGKTSSSHSKGRHQSATFPNRNSNNSNSTITSSKSQFISMTNSFASSSGLTPGTGMTPTLLAASAAPNYGSPINMMTTSLYGDGSHHGQLGNLSLSSESVSMAALGNSHCSPMDSTSAAYQYRKWWTSGLIVDNSQNSSSLGRWFQV